MDEMISKELQITPHLLALESFTKTTPASSNSSFLASVVVNKFALQDVHKQGLRRVGTSILIIYSRHRGGMELTTTQANQPWESSKATATQ